MAATVAHEVAIYSVCQVAAYAVCWKASERLMPKAPDRAFSADALYGIFYYPALVLLALDATVRLGADVTTRWEGTVRSSQVGIGSLLPLGASATTNRPRPVYIPADRQIDKR
mmetsp:Transcript_37260/g.100838  ORF Transcript_37260/g.100838 Transcript_37260/m.100838 type:complete len:113 (+) Transcript_37260:174-512(+)